MWLSHAPGARRATRKSVSATKDGGCSCLSCHLTPVSMTMTDDVLKRGKGEDERRETCLRAELWEEPAQEAWHKWAVCLVCLPPSSPGRQAAFLEHSRPPSVPSVVCAALCCCRVLPVRLWAT